MEPINITPYDLSGKADIISQYKAQTFHATTSTGNVGIGITNPQEKLEVAEKFAGRYFATPKKVGVQTVEVNTNAGIAAANQIADFIKNGNDRFRVNK